MKVSTALSNENMEKRNKRKMFGNHENYLARITKTLYYAQLPKSDRTSLPVTELAAEIFSAPNRKFSLDYLDTKEAAELSSNACVSPCSLVLALLYLDKLKKTNPKYLSRVSPSELFLVSLLIGSKFLQDEGEEDEVNNDEWAASAGLSVQDLNKAERDFLKAIDWEVYVSEDAFWKRLEILERNVSLREGCNRGWFTYTDLNSLIALIDVTNIITTLLTVTSVCLASYIASVLTVVGSTALVRQLQIVDLPQQMLWTGTNNNVIGPTDDQFETSTFELNITDVQNCNNTILNDTKWTLWPTLRLCHANWMNNFNFQHLTWPIQTNLLNSFKYDISPPMINWVDLVKECLTKKSMYTDLVPLVSY